MEANNPIDEKGKLSLGEKLDKLEKLIKSGELPPFEVKEGESEDERRARFFNEVKRIGMEYLNMTEEEVTALINDPM
ncbi:hypothetical protein EDM00_03180 [Ornithobacterium rhinotracheale]|uniref:hypothetical protein n=1 Tax=Ornithobacterium rhinotracheale TaxID=28251 RepID=UPI00129CFF8F|nr:hypothetical protein [Ornithobacterium rhinotracheale]MRI62996.1 hypothetical protein [Ornithobacterium rhinotracheale]MRJ11663.1 hypothetical protein [Ornithobacterium rhinotracheale]